MTREQWQLINLLTVFCWKQFKDKGINTSIKLANKDKRKDQMVLKQTIKCSYQTISCGTIFLISQLRVLTGSNHFQHKPDL